MTALEWDRIGERFFETGIDRGVLYTVDGLAFPWNGLTGVQENASGEVKSFWMDGVKYLDHHVPGSYSAKLEAFTYPDVLDSLTGVTPYAPGIYLHDQAAKVFHLCYRTGVGNDIEQQMGYKIHVIYNVMALPSSSGLNTLSNSVEPAKMSWDLTGTPPQMFGVRPTAHIHVDTLRVDSDLLALIEALLYGTAESDPTLPSMVDLLTLIEGV